MYDAPAAPTVLRQVMLETTASRIAVAIALPALAGCGDSTRSTDYFPLTPGSQWQYRIERTTMDGTGQLRYLIKVEVPTPDSSADLRSRVTFDGQRFQYKLADEGIYRIGVQRVQQPTLAADSQPQMVLPSKLVLDEQWRGLSMTAVLETRRPPFESMFRAQVPVEMHYRVTSLDSDVTTPAGDFKNCLLVTGQGSAETDLGNGIGQTRITVTSSEWFAPNVGLVRMDHHETSSAPALRAGAMIMKLDNWSHP